MKSQAKVSQHTPGQWIYDDSHTLVNRNVIRMNGLIIATIQDSTTWKEGEKEANAKLLAAAPETAAERDRLKEINKELVEACKLGYEESLRLERAGNGNTETRLKLKLAIARAEAE